ncbi:tetratricopeptide repeat-containing sensor histidine kinase [Mangrovimonas spongiae]|nr:histidine kinase [Mangrovimonas spongiae]
MPSIAQDNLNNSAQKEQHFIINGLVKERENNQPISNVEVQVFGQPITRTNPLGEFKIKVKKGDELVIKHEDFHTVYYTVINDEDITVEVVSSNIPTEAYYNNQRTAQAYKNALDSVKKYKKIDVEKSLQFATEALAKSRSTQQNAKAYEIIADVYMQWKQYDLSISNYRISLQSKQNNEVVLKLAKAYNLNKNFSQSIQTYLELPVEDLTNLQYIMRFEGLGDAYTNEASYVEASKSYNRALKRAETDSITPKITDLNSKIAKMYMKNGQIEQAQSYFGNSLNLASKENKKRALEETVTVADFQHTNRAYDNEINLRKQALENIIEIENDTVFDNESALTPQKQNYKIGNAYYLQKDFDSAVAYLERSVKEADDKEDLVVKKDAKRKLSEVYSSSGNDEKALETYKEYTEIVEELYIKKEQEIVRAAKFSRDISNKQNRIKSLENERELSESKYQLTLERNKRQQLIIYSLIGGVLLLCILAYLMYKYIKQQRLANNLLALKSLRSQMNPHFIFNALNSVNNFIALNDERTANKYLTDFSFLMRAVLENSEEDFIPLQKEIELLQLYVKLEHFRFQDKFDYTITVDNAININEFKIPPMLLQPYIENAVWHGLRYKKDKGQLNIDLKHVSNNEIAITITDNGIGRERSKALKTPNQKKHNSKGLSNIKKRVAILNNMYKDKIDVFITDLNPKAVDVGTKVKVTIKKD